MQVRLLNAWEELRSSYWFVPSVMTVAAVLLSFATISLDERVARRWLQTVGFVWAGGPEGARGLLSTVSGSMITVAGVVFSMMLVALSQASAQFGPHLLRNFMRNSTNQVVLGTFVATYVYGLLVLRTIRNGEQGAEFVPHVSVTVCLGLVLLSLGVLIYFIHHMALSVQAPHVIAGVADDLKNAIARLGSAQPGEAAPPAVKTGPLPPDFEAQARPIRAEADGYVQAIDDQRLLELAVKHDLVLRLHPRPGQFLTRSEVLVEAVGAAAAAPAVQRALRKTVLLGRQRTQTQDLEFAIDQLVQIAVRALSPGANDPFTAMACIDWLSAALGDLATRDFPASWRYDAAGVRRVQVERPPTFTGLTQAAFHQIRQSVGASVAVRIRLLEGLTRIAARAETEPARAAVREQGALLMADLQPGSLVASDQADLEAAYHRLLTQLDARATPPARLDRAE